MRVLACALLLAAVPSLHAQPGPAATVRQDGDAIVFRGRIDAASAAEFLRLLADARVTRLVISSVGGLVAPALDMAEALHARGLDVQVEDGCRSSCANYVFAAGRRKLLAGPASVAWHGNIAHVLYRQERGEEHWGEAEMAQARALARREAAFYRRIGVDGFVCWFGKIAPYEVPGFYALSAPDMAGFGVGDVTVRDAAAPLPEDVRLLAVDWLTLEASRPAPPGKE